LLSSAFNVRDKLSQWTACLARLPDTPERTALAFGMGVFFGFSPFLGLQTILGIVLAYLGRLSKLAVILGTWVNLPWVVPAYYALATELGARLLGVEPPSRLVAALQDTIARAGFGFGALGEVLTLLRPMLWPFVVGTTLAASLLGIVAYRVMLRLLRVSRSHDPQAVPPVGP
jgi:uncharacterized protein (DUF2062 family)